MPRPGRFTPGKETRYPFYRRLGGPQGRSGRVRKISPPRGFDPRTVQPVASRYTDYAIPAHIILQERSEMKISLNMNGKVRDCTKTLNLIERQCCYMWILNEFCLECFDTAGVPSTVMYCWHVAFLFVNVKNLDCKHLSRRVRKTVAKRDYYVRHVYLPARPSAHMEHLDPHGMDVREILYWKFSLKSVDQIQVC
jgi:hypothetical protein